MRRTLSSLHSEMPYLSLRHAMRTAGACSPKSCDSSHAIVSRRPRTEMQHKGWSAFIQLQPHLLSFPACLQQLTARQHLLKLLRSYAFDDFCRHMIDLSDSEQTDRLSIPWGRCRSCSANDGSCADRDTLVSSKATAFCIVWPLQLLSTNALAASTCSRHIDLWNPQNDFHETNGTLLRAAFHSDVLELLLFSGLPQGALAWREWKSIRQITSYSQVTATVKQSP